MVVRVGGTAGDGGSMVVSPGGATAVAAGIEVLPSWPVPMVSVTVSMMVSVVSPQTVGKTGVPGVSVGYSGMSVVGVPGVSGVSVVSVGYPGVSVVVPGVSGVSVVPGVPGVPGVSGVVVVAGGTSMVTVVSLP